jgi:carboxyl-terminal processing protease
METEENIEKPASKPHGNWYVRLPILLAITLSAGIFIGAKLFGGNDPDKKADIGHIAEKIRQILFYVDNFYVDTVDTEKIAEQAIDEMLHKLDPHSSYIPAKDLAMMNAQLEGDFEGIGIEFNIIRDTLVVVTPLSGGPSEAVGLRSGDKIIEVDGIKLASDGKKLTTQDVFSKLRGKKGTQVKLGVLRKGSEDLIQFNIIRDKIPSYTVDASYMIDKETGYIKVSRFGANTYDEFKAALEKLNAQKMKKLLLDLRGNPGGYMDRAVKMADEMIPGNALLVYTDGKGTRFDERYKAQMNGIFEKGPIVVLIDEGSASASEIVSGALQDNDRALIAGRRSFGKGLVQKPIPLLDGSELRLTISRYYMPSGRSIQKPYENIKQYEMDLYERYRSGEMYKADSSKLDKSKEYKTAGGRTVYGGGGVMPDVFIPNDTSHYTPLLSEIYGKTNIVREFAIEYANSKRDELKKMGTEDFVKKFAFSAQEQQTIISQIKAQGVKWDDEQFKKSSAFLYNQIKAQIARVVWHDESFYRVLSTQDNEFQRALQLFGEAEKIEKKKF